jgi:hypothetical protein
VLKHRQHILTAFVFMMSFLCAMSFIYLQSDSSIAYAEPFAKSDGIVGTVRSPEVPSSFAIYQWTYIYSPWYQQFHNELFVHQYELLLHDCYNPGSSRSGTDDTCDWNTASLAFYLPHTISSSDIPSGFDAVPLFDYQHTINPSDNEYRPSYHLYTTMRDDISLNPLDFQFRGTLGKILVPEPREEASPSGPFGSTREPAQIPEKRTCDSGGSYPGGRGASSGSGSGPITGCQGVNLPLYRFSVCDVKIGQPPQFLGYIYTFSHEAISTVYGIKSIDVEENNFFADNPSQSSSAPNRLGHLTPKCPDEISLGLGLTKETPSQSGGSYPGGSGASSGSGSGPSTTPSYPGGSGAASGSPTTPTIPPSEALREQEDSITTTLIADPQNYVGQCPAHIQFNGIITDNVGGRDVTFRFIRSDGATAAGQTIHFDAPGSQSVSTTWDLGDVNLLPSYKGWHAIEVINPVNIQSNQAEFEITCSS